MITKEIILTNYEWYTDEAAMLNACLRNDELLSMMSACKSYNILGFTSMDNGLEGETCVGYVEFEFEPEVEMLHTLGQPI
jgi:hypothetical protein